VRDEAKGTQGHGGLLWQQPRLVDLAALGRHRRRLVDVPCLAAHSSSVAGAGRRARRIFMAAVGGCADRSHATSSTRAARRARGIIVATGALLGLDAVRATAEGKIRLRHIVTRKPPAGLAGGARCCPARAVWWNGLNAARSSPAARASHRGLPRQRQRMRGAVARRQSVPDRSK